MVATKSSVPAPTGAIVVEAHTAAAWPELAATWAELASRSSETSFFVSPDWVQAWLDEFGAALAPTVLVFRDGATVVGACLLVRRTVRRGPFRVRTLYLNTAGEDEHESPCLEFNTLLCAPGSEDRVAVALRDYLDGLQQIAPWDELVAEGLAEGPAFDALRAAFADLTAIAEAKPSYYVALDELRAGKDYIQTLGGRDRTRYRQNVRKYSERGELVLDRAGSVDEALAILDELAQLHQKTWTERGFPGAFASERFCAFHRRLVERCFARGEIELVRLRAGDATVGCLYNFVYRSKVYFYQCGYDYALVERTSPGMVVHAFAVKRAAAAGLAEYDFMAGDVDYKRKLATRHRELHWLAWRAPGVKMRTFELARRTRHKLAAAHKNVRERAGATDVTTLLARVGARIRRDARLGVQRTLLYRLDREDPRPAQLGDSDVTIAPIARDALDRLASLGPFDRAEGERRLDRGDLCYGAWLGGELAHYSWVQRAGEHAIASAGVTVTVDDGDVWIYNCRTGDAFRGKGLYPRTLARILDDAFAAGAQRAWIYNEERNVASEHGIVRVGFQQCAILRALRIGRHIRPLGR